MIEKNFNDLKAKLQTKWRKVYRAIAKEDNEKSGKI
jgi:hypothetical protein